ncbi:MAG: hypothetical protein IK061_08535, partial [Desulfovibrio sp.]|nr:hypothetical protein [Desulfovibrio sp.]
KSSSVAAEHIACVARSHSNGDGCCAASARPAPRSATDAVYVVASPEDISGEEIVLIGDLVRDWASPDANLIFGVIFDSGLEDEIRVTVVAAGYGCILWSDGTAVPATWYRHSGAMVPPFRPL